MQQNKTTSRNLTSQIPVLGADPKSLRPECRFEDPINTGFAQRAEGSFEPRHSFRTSRIPLTYIGDDAGLVLWYRALLLGLSRVLETVRLMCACLCLCPQFLQNVYPQYLRYNTWVHYFVGVPIIEFRLLNLNLCGLTFGV